MCVASVQRGGEGEREGGRETETQTSTRVACTIVMQKSSTRCCWCMCSSLSFPPSLSPSLPPLLTFLPPSLSKQSKTAGGKSSLASSGAGADPSAADDGDKAGGKKAKRPAEPDVVVKFDKYLGEEWHKFYKKHWGSDQLRQTQRGAGEGGSWRAEKPGSRRALHRSSLYKRISNDMANADFLE